MTQQSRGSGSRPGDRNATRYEALAAEFAQAIEVGQLPPGARLPSIRKASRSRGVSPSTVFQAFYLLEAQGLVEARPRSGFFVRRPLPRQAEPTASLPPDGERTVSISDLVFQVFGRAQERAIIPLGSAFPSPTLFPLDKLAQALARAARRLDPWRALEHFSPGSDELRRHIGVRYLAARCVVDPGEIVITNGAMEALNVCLEAVTRPGDVVAVESPTFYPALQALERLGLKAVEVATHPRTGVDPDALAAVLQRHPVKACWLMPNFQNPLGALMPDAAKQRLVALLARHEVPLIEDGVYDELYFGARPPRPAKAWDKAGLVMHCGSFSKSLAPGYRVGWAAAGKFARQVARRKLMNSMGTPVPSQESLNEYLRRGGYDRHLRTLRQTLARQHQAMRDAVMRHFPEGTRTTRPEGGYFLWVELPPAVDALELHRLALAQRISLAPGHLFSPGHDYRHHIRLNFGHPDNPRAAQALRVVGRLASTLAAAGAR